MHRRVSALDIVAATPWAIEPDMLDTIRAIALREGDGVEALQAREGRPLTNARTVTMRDGVAVVPITGPIFRYANLFTQISGATSLDVLAKDFAAALDDPAVRAIVLDINSPGGQATGVSEFAAQVHAAAKPVVAYVGGMAASAAYWIAAAAPQIVMSKSAMAGNIGAVLGLDTRKDPNKTEIVSSQSPNKRPDVGTDAGRAQLQGMVDALAQVFIDDVAAYRGMTSDAVVKDFGAGDIFIAAKAVAAGMADRIGTLEDVIAGLAGKQSMPAKPLSMKGPTMNLATLKAEHQAVVAELLSALTLGELQAANPALVLAISADASTIERTRILAVEAQSMPGHEALIAAFKADGKTTAPEAAVQILAAEKAVLGAKAGALKADAPAAVAHAAAPAAADAADASLPLDERIKAKWDKSPALQAEFGSNFANFAALEKADAAGQVRILSGNK
jgi:ClpP class serine protease